MKDGTQRSGLGKWVEGDAKPPIESLKEEQWDMHRGEVSFAQVGLRWLWNGIRIT